MKCLTKDEFLSADDLPLVPVPLPEELYGKDVGVFVRSMDGTEKAMLEERFQNKEPTDDILDFRGTVLVSTIVNEKGQRLFSDKDRDAVMGKNAEGLETIFEKACDLNGFRAKDVEALAKNSETTPSS